MRGSKEEPRQSWGAGSFPVLPDLCLACSRCGRINTAPATLVLSEQRGAES